MEARLIYTGAVIGGPCQGAKDITAHHTWDGRIKHKEKDQKGRYLWNPVRQRWVWFSDTQIEKMKQARSRKPVDFT